MSTTIETLELEIQSNSTNAVNGIDALTQSLAKLKNATSGGLGLTAVVKGIKGLNDADTSSVAGNVQNLVAALTPLSNLSKSNLSSFITPLKNLPKVFSELNKVDMGAFATKIQEVTTAMKPLATEMEKVSNGFSAMPTKIQKLLNATNQIPTSNKKSSTSFADLYLKIRSLVNGIVALGKSIWSAITKSNDYIENVNLFTVSMGEYASEAKEYAETVSEAMGIDTSEWMRDQGVFMTMATGFGVAGDRAATMSKNLTQLGYDLASFYNMDVEDAMTKLKSGLAGELEPLRAIGYDLSQAKLEATALELGIDKAVSAMTQAEKAELRYYAIMTQVTTSHGDMEQTLEDPANQIRVLKAEFNMAAREIGNIFIPALNAILPYVIAVTKVIRILASNIAGLFGYKPDDISDSTSTVVENTNAVQENLQGAQEEAKKLKSYMLGFDELNVINPNEGSSSEDELGTGFDFELPELDEWTELEIDSKVATIVEEMKEWLGLTEDIDSWSELFDTRLGNILISAGAISGVLLAWKISDGVKKTIDAIDKLSKAGSFSLGVTLVVAGITIGAMAIESALTEGLNGANITSIVGASALIIAGAALIGKTFGKALIGTAIGAIIVGVAGLGVGLYDAIKNELDITNGLTIVFATTLIGLGVAALIPAVKIGMGAIMGAIIGAAIIGSIWIIQNTEDTLTKIGGVVAGAALAVGAVLAFTGINIPLGIALMAMGAVTMGTAIAMNTDALSNEVKGVIAVITGLVSVAALVVGAVLAFSGTNIPLGIALMAGGALAMGTAIVPKWEELSDTIQNTISIIFAVVSPALLVLGAVLAFSGSNIPLGIGLMLAGATSLATASALNWDSLPELLRGPVGLVVSLVSGALLALGAILAFSGAAIPLGIALMLAGAGGLATVTALNWNSIKEALEGPVGDVTTFISAAMLTLGAILAFSGVAIPLGIALMLAGATGLVTVTALNWETVVENIKTPVGLITTIVSAATLALGAILAFSGVGIPLGIGLIFAGAAGLATTVSVDWSSIQRIIDDVIEEILSAVSNWWDGLFGGKDAEVDVGMNAKVGVSAYATGGFPEQGQLFVAREAGAEMVGNIGRRTAVANNDQIVSGIAGGVAEANEEQNALLREQNSLLRAILEKDSGVYLDGKNLTNSVEKYQRERGRVLITGGVL